MESTPKNMVEVELPSKSWRESKRLLLVVVTVALFIDFILLSTVVPVIPRYLYEIKHAELMNETKKEVSESTSTSRTTFTQTEAPTNNIATNFNERTNSTDDFRYKTIQEKINSTNEILESRNKANTKNGFHSEFDTTVEENFQNSSVEVGMLLGSKPFVQLIANPFVGQLTQKFGYNKPMFVGFIILFFSTLTFAFGQTYEVLFFSRAFQGIGSSCSVVAGLSALASRYTNQKQRDNAIRIAYGGIALGIMCGPPFGGFMYQYFGKMSPFFAICCLTLIDGVLQLLMKAPKKIKTEEKVKPPSLWALLKDPYILITAAGVFLTCSVFTLFETCLPLWMLDTMNPSKSELGTVLIPTIAGFILVLNIIGHWLLKLGRWRLAMIGMTLVTVSLMAIPFSKSIALLLTPNLGLGLGIGMVHAALIPEFAYIVDIRHTAMYGNVYAISDTAMCLGSAVGPLSGGFILKQIGFTWIMIGAGVVTIVYTPVIYLLRNPPIKNKKQPVDEKSSARLIKNGHAEEKQ